MSDGTSSEASYEYESESQHWDFGGYQKTNGGFTFPPAEISIAMEVGIMDMLTVIRPDDVDRAGIRFVERRIRSRCREETIQYSTERWLLFWVYFRRTWLVLFPVNVWNVHEMDLQIVSRTNNPLERFNRELNAAITAPHPRLSAFVGMIEVLSQRY
ncbi:hypothetical protein PHMEG_00041443, partial [Phytophthora megakarya]